MKIRPEQHSIWQHTSGRMYRVEFITNLVTSDDDKYPTTVVYSNVKNGTLWSRPLGDWERSFKLYDAMEIKK